MQKKTHQAQAALMFLQKKIAIYLLYTQGRLMYETIYSNFRIVGTN